MVDQILTAGDVAPRLEAQLLNADGTSPNLEGATVECRVMRADRRTQPWTSEATLVNARGGYVAHDWVPAEVERSGMLLVQFRRTDTGKEQSWPVDRYLKVLVNPALTPGGRAVSP